MCACERAGGAAHLVRGGHLSHRISGFQLFTREIRAGAWVLETHSELRFLL